MVPFDCAMCGAVYPVRDELAGGAHNCRKCGELGKVLEPKGKRKATPPPEPVRAPIDEPDLAPVTPVEPWYFRFLEAYAHTGALLGSILCLLALFGIFAASLGSSPGPSGPMLAAAIASLGLAVLGIWVSAAFILLAVDVPVT
jgi:ribosomal protein L40E